MYTYVDTDIYGAYSILLLTSNVLRDATMHRILNRNRDKPVVVKARLKIKYPQ